MAACAGSAAVPHHLHGVSRGRAHARPPQQEGPQGAAQDARLLPQVLIRVSHSHFFSHKLSRAHYGSQIYIQIIIYEIYDI